MFEQQPLRLGAFAREIQKIICNHVSLKNNVNIFFFQMIIAFTRPTPTAGASAFFKGLQFVIRLAQAVGNRQR